MRAGVAATRSPTRWRAPSGPRSSAAAAPSCPAPGPALRRLGELSGAVLATSAVANGLFAGDPFAVGISGGFATPTAQRLLEEADLIVAFGAALNVWTTRHGALIAGHDGSIQVDRDEEAIGAHRPVDLGVVGDARETAEALIAALGDAAASASAARGAASRWPRRSRPARWRDEPYEALARLARPARR